MAALDEYLGNKPATSVKPDGRLAYRRAEAAEKLGVSLRGFDDLLARGAMKFRREGRTVLISKSDLARFLKEGNS